MTTRPAEAGALLDEAIGRIARHTAVINKIRELHRMLNGIRCSDCGSDIDECICPDDVPTERIVICEECNCRADPEYDLIEWPCPTIAIIEQADL